MTFTRLIVVNWLISIKWFKSILFSFRTKQILRTTTREHNTEFSFKSLIVFKDNFSRTVFTQKVYAVVRTTHTTQNIWHDVSRYPTNNDFPLNTQFATRDESRSIVFVTFMRRETRIDLWSDNLEARGAIRFYPFPSVFRHQSPASQRITNRRRCPQPPRVQYRPGEDCPNRSHGRRQVQRHIVHSDDKQLLIRKRRRKSSENNKFAARKRNERPSDGIVFTARSVWNANYFINARACKNTNAKRSYSFVFSYEINKTRRTLNRFYRSNF